MIDIPLGILMLFMLFMFLLAGMAYEVYMRPWILTHPIEIKPRRKLQ